MADRPLAQRTYHGPITTLTLAQALVGEFNQGNLRAQVVGESDPLVVQIASRPEPASGGPTALTVQLHGVEDGVHVQIGQQAWYGVAASLAETGLWALKNPWTLISRLDDLAEDLSSFGLTDRVWSVLDRTAKAAGASHQISERLRRLTCSYCLTANEVGAPSCVACGAPLGRVQPKGCPNCGYVASAGTPYCPQCGEPLTG
jgi:hypothetical protein